MKILITGSEGFIAKNLKVQLENLGITDVFQFNKLSTLDDLKEYCKDADFVYHLAGINRPIDEIEFMKGNYGLTEILLSELRKANNFCPVVMTSSIQAELENPYGISKRASEEVLEKYQLETGAKTFIYRLPNVFGKWCKPNYNSAIATFCHNIARDQEIIVNNSDTELTLVYIDDVLEELITLISIWKTVNKTYLEISNTHKVKLGKIVEYLYSFKKSRELRTIPNLSDPFVKKLYSTYLSYLPTDQFSYPLKMNVDERGSFTEFIRTPDRGQVSINISKPGITKGNHWHHTKNEKFLVVSGQGIIRFRHIHSHEIIEYAVNGNELNVVDIPVGYTHNIENTGNTEMVTVMWVNEAFDPEKPDTYFMEV